SKPFDSQQLLAQVEALLDRVPPAAAEPITAPETTARIPIVTETSREDAPFDEGFSTEDFTASIRVPPRHEGTDPFEEEYGRVDVDSAIEAFEKAQPPSTFGARSSGPETNRVEPSQDAEESAREPLAPWLREEPDRPAGSAPAVSDDLAATVSVQGLDFSLAPTEVSEETVAMKLPLGAEPRDASPQTPEEISEEQARALFDVEPPPALFVPEPPAPASAEASAARAGTTAEVPREIEELAQTSSIPELTQMLSSVARPGGGNDLTDEQIERLAARVVEKLSDRIVREIAWEVIPEMAEIVIKQRIKELEAGVE
ncbi:MAG TPA: hypothetical protein VK780_01080, partial [Thermoanaerobaculia bacterium]|nr:hypothetical protein [Thermoanaerobaculia bacterium]